MNDEKPSWDDSTPPWAKWLAQDADGAWYWYSERPHVSTSNPVWMRSPTSKFERAGWSSSSHAWRTSLEPRQPPPRKAFPR